MRRRGLLSLAVVLAASLGAVPSQGAAGLSLPRGYRVVARRTLGRGLVEFTVRRSSPPAVVHVARLEAGAPFRLRVVKSRGRVEGPMPRTEATSAMCRRVDCLVGVNGDFFSRSGVPLGGVLAAGQPVRSATTSLPQLLIDDRPVGLGSLPLSGSLVRARRRFPDAPVPIDAWEDVAVGIAAVNVARGDDRIVLYTPRFGPRTGTGRGGAEMIVRFPDGPLRVGTPFAARALTLRTKRGNAAIPADGAVLSGSGEGARALRAVWDEIRAGTAKRQVRVRIDSAHRDSLGGHPVLVRDGEERALNPSYFARSRHPRSAVAWGPGASYLVTVDGRSNASAGWTLYEAQTFLHALGARDGLNFDGGGSATHVVRGRVRNRPSDGRERWVSVALVVVAA